MRNNQIFLYYKERTYFNFDETMIFLEKKGYCLKNPHNKSITIYQQDGDSEVNYGKAKELFVNNKPFCIIVWLNDLLYLTLSFYSEDEYFVLTFYLSQLDNSQIMRISETLISYTFNEIKRVGDKFLGLGIDIDGHTYDYDFEYFFDGTNKNVDLQYLPDVFLIPKVKMNNIAIDNKFDLIDIDDSFICMVKNKFLLTYLETLIKLE